MIEALARSLGVTHVTGLDGVEALGVFGFAAVRPAARGLTCTLGADRDEKEARRRALVDSVGAALSERPRPVILDSEAGLTAASLAFVPHEVLGRPSPGASIVPWIEARDLPERRSVLLPYAAIHGIEAVPEWPGGVGTRGGIGSGATLAEAVDDALERAIVRRAIMRALNDPAGFSAQPIALREDEILLRIARGGLHAGALVSADGAVVAGVWDDLGGFGLAGSAASIASAAFERALIDAIADWSARRTGLFDSVAPIEQDPSVRAGLILRLADASGTAIPLDAIDVGPRVDIRRGAIAVPLSDVAAEPPFAEVVLFWPSGGAP